MYTLEVIGREALDVSVVMNLLWPYMLIFCWYYPSHPSISLLDLIFGFVCRWCQWVIFSYENWIIRWHFVLFPSTKFFDGGGAYTTVVSMIGSATGGKNPLK